jgi:hypothetical protein
MEGTTLDRHRCPHPRCGRPFAVVYRSSFHDVPIPMAVACPTCGCWDVVMVPTGAVHESEGAWVLPLDYHVVALAG